MHYVSLFPSFFKKKAFRKWGVFTLQLDKVFWLEKYFYYLCSVQKLGYKFLEYLSANSCSGPFDTDSIYFQNNKVQIMAFFPQHFLFPRTHYSVSLGSPFFIVLLTVWYMTCFSPWEKDNRKVVQAHLKALFKMIEKNWKKKKLLNQMKIFCDVSQILVRKLKEIRITWTCNFPNN